MKIVHTSYLLTTVLFLIIATFLLTEKPQAFERFQKLDEGNRRNEEISTIEKSENQSSETPSLVGLPKLEVVATGYYAGIESTGKDMNHPQYGITYSGAKVIRDPENYSTIAADLNVFPLGTILYIPGYGYGIVADIGSAIKGNKIDLYFETIDDVYNQWGKKTLDVYVVKQGEGFVSDKMIAELNENKAINVNLQVQDANVTP